MRSKIRPGWDVSYFTDQLTPSFSGGSTINGTPDGDRSARVLGGRIGRLSLRPFTESTLTALANEFENAKSWKTRNPAVPKTHHEIYSSPATATTSRRRATKHVPRVSPYSPASIDPGFMEIALVQLSQSVKSTNVTHTHRQTDTQTD